LNPRTVTTGTGHRIKRRLRTALLGSLLLAGSLTTAAFVGASPASAADTVVRTINLGCSNNAISADGTDVWVSYGCAGEPGGPIPTGGLAELNAKDGSVVLGGGYTALGASMAVSSDGTHVWSANANGTVTELNASNGSVVQKITVAGTPFGVSSDGTHVWVADYSGNTVTELNASDGSVVQTIAVGSEPTGISSDGTHVWVTNSADNTVTELNASDGSVVQTITVGSDPLGISSDGTSVWVANNGDNTVTQLNASTGAFVQTIAVGSEPTGVSSDGTRVWVSNFGDGTVSEIANPPSTTVVLPSNGATISGTDQYFDATASSSATSVVFELTGGPPPFAPYQIATGTPTLYGWLGTWNTTTQPNATYTLVSIATETDGVSGTSTAVSVTVDNPPPTTTVVLPTNNATISGTTQYLDATASSSVTSVRYQLSGGPSDLSDVQIATGTRTLYGWLAAWNTTTVANGSYTLQSVASYAGGVSGTSAAITVTVDNPDPATTVVFPANDATVSGTSQYLDATASSSVTSVIYQLSGGPSDLSDVQIATGTPTIYGWLAAWNTTTVLNGTYTLQSVASYAGGVSGTSTAISVTVSNT
jgi:YVTN family beta-propeller protein